MGRVVTVFEVTFEFLQPWAVGGVAQDDPEIDLPVVLDAADRPYVPASSLVGSLRRHLGDRGLDAERWLGPDIGPAGKITNDGKGNELRRRPSPLRALGTRLAGVEPTLTVRATTKISSKRAAAEGGTLRAEHRVEIPEDRSPGSASLVKLIWFATLDQAGTDPLVTELVLALKSWQPVIGRGRSKGMGSARVSQIRRISLDLGNPDDLTWWLVGRRAWFEGAASPGPAVEQEDGDQFRCVPPSRRICFEWQVADPLAIGTGESSPRKPGTTRLDGSVRRKAAARALRLDGGAKTAVVPATAWKGVFRHRVEFILNAIECTPEQVASHRDRLFGRGSNEEDGGQSGHRGVLTFVDSLIKSPQEGPAVIWERSHVGIDRITGGARRGTLFAVEAVAPGARLTQVIECDRELTERDRKLLSMAAKDIHDGLVGLGGMTTRGYGSLSLTQACFENQRFDGLTAHDFATPSATETKEGQE